MKAEKTQAWKGRITLSMLEHSSAGNARCSTLMQHIAPGQQADLVACCLAEGIVQGSLQLSLLAVKPALLRLQLFSSCHAGRVCRTLHMHSNNVGLRPGIPAVATNHGENA